MNKTGKEYFRLFLTLSGCILVYFLLANFGEVRSWLGGVLRVFNPVLYGFIIAYLLNPVMTLFTKLFCKMRKKDEATRGLRVGALICTYVFAVLAVSAIVLIIVPQAISGVNDLRDKFKDFNFTDFMKNVPGWFVAVRQRLEELLGNELVQKGWESAKDYLEQTFHNLGNSDNISQMMGSLPGVVSSFGSTVVALLLGVCLSIYMLFDKDNLISRLKKIVYTLFKKGTANRIVLFFRETDETVGNFINGKILDSLIIGVLSYVVFLIFKIPFPGLFAVVVGITNIIPMFGPFIGGFINGALLLLTFNWNKLIPFIIIIIVIQQIDGNIIGPKILGKATGLSGLWVIIALTVGGGFFGLWGMILAVPVFTVLYRGFGKLVDASLAGSGLPTDTAFYNDYPPHAAAHSGGQGKKPSFWKRMFGRRKKKKAADDGPEGKGAPESDGRETAQEKAPDGEKENADG